MFEDGIAEEDEDGLEHSNGVGAGSNGLLMPHSSSATNYHYSRVGHSHKSQLNKGRKSKNITIKKDNSESNLFDVQRRSQQPHSHRMFSASPTRKMSHPQLGLDSSIPCKEEVLELYSELQSSGVPQIMSRFEEVVGTLCREIGEYI